MKNNLLKRYFLYVGDHPFLYHFLIAAAFLITIGIINITEKEVVSYPWERWILRWWWIFAIAIALHYWLVLDVTARYISRTSHLAGWERLEDFLFCVLVTSDGRQIILDKPVWEKGEKYYISLPDDYKETEESWNVSVNVVGKYKNSTLVIPVELAFNLYRPLGQFCYDKLEMFETLSRHQPDSQNLELYDYVVDVFKKINAPNQEKFDALAERYFSLVIPEPVLMNEAVDVIMFPEKIFACVKDVKICLKKPLCSACKGVSCLN